MLRDQTLCSSMMQRTNITKLKLYYEEKWAKIVSSHCTGLIDLKHSVAAQGCHNCYRASQAESLCSINDWKTTHLFVLFILLGYIYTCLITIKIWSDFSDNLKGFRNFQAPPCTICYLWTCLKLSVMLTLQEKKVLMFNAYQCSKILFNFV